MAGKNYIEELSEDFVSSSEGFDIYNWTTTAVSKEDLQNQGVYQEGENYYRDVWVYNNGEYGYIKTRVLVIYNDLSETYVATTRPYGIVGQRDTAEFLIDMMTSLGLELNRDLYQDAQTRAAFMLDELRNEFWEALPDEEREKAQSILDTLQEFILDEYSTCKYDKNVVDLVYNYIQRYYGPFQLGVSFECTPITRDEGYNVLYEYGHDEMGDLLGWAFAEGHAAYPTYGNPDGINEYFMENLYTDEDFQDDLYSHPFVRIGYIEIMGAISAIVVQMYNIQDNTVNVHDYGTFQEMDGTSLERIDYSYDMDDHGVMTFNRREVHTMTEGITFQNRWHSWNWTHGIGCYDLIGYSGQALQFKVIGIPPIEATREENYPTWAPDPDDPFVPVAPDPPDQPSGQTGGTPPTFRPKPARPFGTTPPPMPDIEDPIGTAPDVDGDAHSLGMYKVFKPTYGEVLQLGQFLWDQVNITDILNIFKNDPMQAIISLHQLYIDPTIAQQQQEIYLGYVDTHVTADTIEDRFQGISCGSVEIERTFNDVRDFQNIISIYLPFIGIKQLDTQEVMGSTLFVDYQVDVFSGDCVATLAINRDGLTDKKVLYMFNGNCSIQVPLSAADKTRLVQGLGQAAVGLVASAFNPMGLLGVAAGITNMAHSTQIEKAGNLTGNFGAMGYKKPYLIIERPKTYDAVDRGNFIGLPCNASVRIGTVSGFSQFKGVHVDTINCTEEEKVLIANLLESGVIL